MILSPIKTTENRNVRLDTRFCQKAIHRAPDNGWQMLLRRPPVSVQTHAWRCTRRLQAMLQSCTLTRGARGRDGWAAYVHKSVLSGCRAKEAKALLRRRDEAYSCLQLNCLLFRS
jgi:hypothetical protein